MAENLKQMSTKITERLKKDPQYRKEFQKDPRKALIEAGVPENLLPEKMSVSEDAISMVGKSGEDRPIASLVVACVVI